MPADPYTFASDADGDPWAMFPDAPEYADHNAAIDAAAQSSGASSGADDDPWSIFPDALEYADYNASLASANAGASMPPTQPPTGFGKNRTLAFRPDEARRPS